MNVTIVSAFRQAAGPQIDRYFDQIERLGWALGSRGDTLHLILGYGDSTDGTGEELFEACQYRFPALLMEVSHGGPHFGSIEDAQRFRQLAQTWNKLLPNIPKEADAVVLLESDLVWEAATLMALIDHLATYPAIAPMILDADPPDRFRDVYAFRRNGVRFTNEAPYHADLNGKVLQVDSAGSVLALRGPLARAVSVPEADVVVGLCRQLYEQGGAVYVDPALKVFHL